MKLDLAGRAGRYPSLDGLRGIAILAVLLRHAAHYWPLPLEGSGWNFWHNGWLGVNLFFALSGFLIFHHLLNNWPKNNIKSFLYTYFLKRTLRIIPVYFAALLIVYLNLIPNYQPTQPITWQITLQHFFFIQEYYSSPLIIPLWSVAVEEKFYLIAPALAAVALHYPPRKTLQLLILLFAAYLTSKLLLIFLAPPSDYSEYFWRLRAPFQHAAINIILGALAALLSHHYPKIKISITARANITNTLYITLIAITCSISWLETQNWLAVDLASLLFTCICAGLIYLHVQPDAIHYPILDSRPLRFFAKISYPLYAIHVILIPSAITINKQISDSPDLNFLSFFMIYFALSITLAIAIHLAIEKPFLHIKESLQYTEQSQPIKTQANLRAP